LALKNTVNYSSRFELTMWFCILLCNFNILVALRIFNVFMIHYLKLKKTHIVPLRRRPGRQGHPIGSDRASAELRACHDNARQTRYNASERGVS
jgi:hypothetical protein